MAELKSIFGAMVRRHRKALGLSQVALAERKETSVSDYSVILERNIFDSSERADAKGGEACGHVEAERIESGNPGNDGDHKLGTAAKEADG